MKKILCLDDYTTRRGQMERFKDLEQKYDCKVEFIKVHRDIEDTKSFIAMQTQLEHNGPDSFPENPDLVKAMEDADIVISHLSAVQSVAVKNAKHLEAVCVMRSGIENVNRETAKECGVKVTNTPGRVAIPVAEFTIGMMIAQMRNIARSHSAIVGGEYQSTFYNSKTDGVLKGKTVGLVGCGQVGSHVAKILKAMEANIIIYDPYCKKEDLEAKGYGYVEKLNDLFAQADVVSVHYRLTPETEKMIGAEQLNLMKPNAVLINTARAGLIDEEALLAVLKDHKIGGAALDVHYYEPLTKESEFVKLDNVTLTAHIAGLTTSPFDLAYAITRDTLDHYFQTGEWINVVRM